MHTILTTGLETWLNLVNEYLNIYIENIKAKIITLTILFNNNVGSTVDPCYSMDKSWKYSTNWKKLYVKSHKLYDPIDTKYNGQSIDTESRLGVARRRNTGAWLLMVLRLPIG